MSSVEAGHDRTGPLSLDGRSTGKPLSRAQFLRLGAIPFVLAAGNSEPQIGQEVPSMPLNVGITYLDHPTDNDTYKRIRDDYEKGNPRAHNWTLPLGGDLALRSRIGDSVLFAMDGLSPEGIDIDAANKIWLNLPESPSNMNPNNKGVSYVIRADCLNITNVITDVVSVPENQVVSGFDAEIRKGQDFGTTVSPFNLERDSLYAVSTLAIVAAMEAVVTQSRLLVKRRNIVIGGVIGFAAILGARLGITEATAMMPTSKSEAAIANLAENTGIGLYSPVVDGRTLLIAEKSVAVAEYLIGKNLIPEDTRPMLVLGPAHSNGEKILSADQVAKQKQIRALFDVQVDLAREILGEKFFQYETEIRHAIAYNLAGAEIYRVRQDIGANPGPDGLVKNLPQQVGQGTEFVTRIEVPWIVEALGDNYPKVANSFQTTPNKTSTGSHK